MRATAHPAWLAVSAAVFAMLVSAIASATPSLWGDEVATLMSASRPLPELFTLLSHMDAVHGAYYLVMHAWLSVAGHSPLALRAPSVIAVGIAAAGVVVLARRTASPRIAMAAAIVFAVLPATQAYAGEARSLAGTLALSVWLVVAWEWAGRRNSARAWLAVTALSAFALLWFVYLGLVLVVLAAWSLWRRRVAIRGALAAMLSAVVAVSPLLVVAWGQRGQVSWIASAGVNGPQQVLVEAWFGWWPLALVAWLALAWSAVAVVRERRWDSLEALALGVALIPLVVLWLASFVVPVLSPRYLVLGVPAVAVVLALRIAAVGAQRRWLSALAITLIVGLAAPVLVAQRLPDAHRGSDWASVAALVAAEARTGDAIVFDESGEPWFRPRLAMRGYPEAFAKLRDLTGLGLRTDTVWDINVRHLTPELLAGASRVWLLERAGARDAADRAVLEGAGYRLAESHALSQTVVVLYLAP